MSSDNVAADSRDDVDDDDDDAPVDGVVVTVTHDGDDRRPVNGDENASLGLSRDTERTERTTTAHALVVIFIIIMVASS